MDKILIGSTAIKHWYDDFTRQPKDKDYIVDAQKVTVDRAENTEYLPCAIMWDLYKGTNKTVLDAEHLTTLKASHLAWNINWDKHMYDLQFLLRKGNKIDSNLFFNLYRYWNTYHEKNKRSDLKMTKEDFFDNAVNYDDNEHDDLHKILNPVPIYTLVLKDNCEVELDENKFHALSHEQKILFVQEETMVMAWERYRKMNYRVAFDKMLKKFIISHCPLFALIFTLENYVEITKININYIKKINYELGTIKSSFSKL